MTAAEKKAEKELDLIIDEVESVIRKPAQKTPKQPKPKKEYNDVNKETYHKAKALHKAEIRKYHKAIFDSHIKVWKTIFKEIGARHQSGKAIRKHKMLKKQAKIAYKLGKS